MSNTQGLETTIRSRLRRALAVVILAGALAMPTSAPAAAIGLGPVIGDGGSAYCCARVNGALFTRDNWALVRVTDSGVVSAEAWVKTSYGICDPLFCIENSGEFSWEGYPYPTGCPGPRLAQAYDFATGAWTEQIPLDCA